MNAAREIAQKSLRQIHIETAKSWARRAIAFYRAAENSPGQKMKIIKCRQGYDDARHEALEHAALAEDNGKTVSKIEKMINRAVMDS